ncbi:hypothetical protein CISIN_1g038008mg [Citrus sinensis]|uniref:Uncharacterized protein n=1 Tax=Citrus sinensis TaxID=2711 RepID=A0A067DA61_CITSI|nr:hypothetical protein CISIN_1g038008mg [Citrus sinensis]
MSFNLYIVSNTLPIGGGAAKRLKEAQNHGGGIEPCVVMTSDPKPRLRWTADLHDRFVDAVTQLGGPSSLFSSPPLCMHIIFKKCLYVKM